MLEQLESQVKPNDSTAPSLHHPISLSRLFELRVDDVVITAGRRWLPLRPATASVRSGAGTLLAGSCRREPVGDLLQIARQLPQPRHVGRIAFHQLAYLAT